MSGNTASIIPPKTASDGFKRIAQVGLIAKGFVYCLLGALTFMAAFHINGKSAHDTDKNGVFDYLYRQTGGQIMLGLVALGLFSYCLWRGIQAFGDTEHKGHKAKGLAVRARYLFSGLVYASVAVHVIMLLLSSGSGSGDQQESIARELLSKPFGQWLVGIGAALLAAVGVYQIYYGMSEKYRKHAEEASANSNKGLLLGAGKVGYVARGIVWLLIAFLFFKAAIHANAAEAGDTSRAFSFLQHAAYGGFLLAAVGAGLVCYGAFNFVRARYDDFD